MNNSTQSRKTLANLAERLGFELSEASSATRMAAANNYDFPLPRWELHPVGNQWASELKACKTLADVATELDHLQIMSSLN